MNKEVYKQRLKRIVVEGLMIAKVQEDIFSVVRDCLDSHESYLAIANWQIIEKIKKLPIYELSHISKYNYNGEVIGIANRILRDLQRRF